MSQEQQQRVALVTGASRGIGRAIALALAQAGHIVVGTATSDKGADGINTALQAMGGRGMVMNVTDQNSIDNALTHINDEVGAPAILVNNAGITRDNIMLRMKDEEWQAIIDTNLSGVYRTTRACLKGMIKQRWGRIVTISSVSGVMGNVGQANYAAAKAGVIGFSKSLAREVGVRSVTANVVAPGFIETDMTSDISDEHRDYVNKQIAVGRFGQPEDIAAAVAFLTSEQAGYITGETLHVNGGLHMV